MFQTRLGKLFFAVVSTLTLLALAAAYDDAQDIRSLLYLQKERELLQVATQMEASIEMPFGQILLDKQAKEMNEEEKTRVLNAFFQPKVDQIAQKYPEVGVGIYSRELDRNIAVGPMFDPAFLRKVTAPGAFQIYQTGTFAALRIEKSVLWDGKAILAVHYPIYRGGEIIGHTFANTPIEDIENVYKAGLTGRVLIIFTIWLALVLFISYVYHKLKQGQEALISAISSNDEQQYSLSDFPEFVPILDSVGVLRRNLEEKNGLLRWVITQGNAGVIVMDTLQNIQIVNEFASRYLELGNRQDTALSEQGSYAVIQGSFYEKILLKALNGQSTNEIRLNTSRGVILLSAAPIYEPGCGKIAAAACYFWDITESERANKLVQTTNQRLLQLVEVCPLPLLELDENGYIVRLNSEMVDFYTEYLPYTKEELIGKSIKEISAELGIDFEESCISKVMAGREVRNEQIEQVGRCWIVNGVPIYDAETGRMSGGLIIYHDITQYELFKNEMARLETLNAIGETASSVAHELRNPATTVRGFIQLLAMKNKGQYQEYYQLIMDELDRMNIIIEDFLSMARNRTVPKSPQDLNDILTSIRPLLQADALKNGIELVYDLCNSIRLLPLN